MRPSYSSKKTPCLLSLFVEHHFREKTLRSTEEIFNRSRESWADFYGSLAESSEVEIYCSSNCHTWLSTCRTNSEEDFLISTINIPLKCALKASKNSNYCPLIRLVTKNSRIWASIRSKEGNNCNQKMFNFQGALGSDEGGWAQSQTTRREWLDTPRGRYSKCETKGLLQVLPRQRSILDREPWHLNKQENCLSEGYLNRQWSIQPTSEISFPKAVCPPPPGRRTGGCLSNIGSR